MNADLDATSLAQRIILCSLLDFEATDDTPVNTAELREAAERRLENADTEAVGHLTEADVMRALNGLSDTDLVEERRPDDRSPAGKGRPEYALAVDVERMRKKLASDDRIASLLE